MSTQNKKAAIISDYKSKKIDKNKDFRKVIIEKARVVFTRYGLKKSTMDDISRAVNRAKSSLYYYFKCKEEIFEAVIEDEVDQIKVALYKGMAAQKAPEDKLRAYVQIRMRMFYNMTNFYTTYQYEYIENYAFIERIRKQYDEMEMQIIKEIFAEGIKKKVFSIADADLAAYILVLMMKAFENPIQTERFVKELDKNINLTLNVLFNGLLTRNKK
ncbi:MAG: TetR/AcrR family transcriptional regulator [Bacteroidota bacterium]